MKRVLPPPPEDLIDVSVDQLRAATATIEQATFDKDVQHAIIVAVAALKTLIELYGLLSLFRITIADLRRRLGIQAPKKEKETKAALAKDDPSPPGGGSPAKDGTKEPHADANGNSAGDDDDDDEPKKPRDEHGRRGKDDFPDAKARYFAHPDFDAPCGACPDCLKAKVYLMGAVGGGIRFPGQAHITVTAIHQEIWRCGDCGSNFPAPLPQDIQDDGGHSRVGYSAAATIAVTKYMYGTPWARQESMSTLVDVDIPASTQWEQVKGLVEAARPVYQCFFKVAAPAPLFYTDDTGAEIHGVTSEEKPQRTTGKTVTRTGVHTSSLVAEFEDGRRMVIYKTGINHAGELADEVLVHRPAGLAKPFHMCDGHSANPPTVVPVVPGECNAHSRRKLELRQETWPKAWAYVEAIYATVYTNEAEAKRLGMTKEQRLELHRRESLPLMKEMFAWMQKCLNDRTVEPNSELGGIFEYFLTREYGLTMFCRYAGFPIDNNPCEGSLKIVALHRKNAGRYRSQSGAEAADVIMSLGQTARYAGENARHYFEVLQRYADKVKADPRSFLPWNYRETVARLEKTAPPPPRRVLEVSAEEFADRQKRLHSQKAWGRAKAKGQAAAPPAAATG